MATATYWIGQDNNIYYGSGVDGAGVLNLGAADGSNGGQYEARADGLYDKYTDSGVPTLTYAANQIADPNAPNSGGQVLGTNTTSGTGYTPAENTQFLNDQEASLNSTLGRNKTALDQGITQNNDQYDLQVGTAQGDKEKAHQTYADQRQGQIKGREDARSTNARNAGQGYRSLAQMIGRASGTGSSAFRDLLPHVVGSDLMSKQKIANETYGTNLQGIDKKQSEYDLNYTNALSDLLRQKKENEGGVRTRFENQNQTILDKIRGVQGDRARVTGGGYAAVKATQAGTDASIEQSKNNVENFFNEFRTPYTRQQATVGTPDLANYTTDRAQINAQQNGQNPDNPYAALLRKKLQA